MDSYCWIRPAILLRGGKPPRLIKETPLKRAVRILQAALAVFLRFSELIYGFAYGFYPSIDSFTSLVPPHGSSLIHLKTYAAPVSNPPVSSPQIPTRT